MQRMHLSTLGLPPISNMSPTWASHWYLLLRTVHLPIERGGGAAWQLPKSYLIAGSLVASDSLPTELCLLS